MSAWTWHIEPVKRTKGTVHRFLVGFLPLEPLPGGKPVELRLYLKQWDLTAAEPGSWCIDLIKYAGAPGETMDPFQPLQHVQVSQRDWDGFFGLWEEGTSVLDKLRALSEMTVALMQAAGAD